MSAGAPDVLVIGSGPAGLAAAETAATLGARVLVAEQMPSVGRKFLMAGRSGLNLTKDEDPSTFRSRISTDIPAMGAALTAFNPDVVVRWAGALGQPVFTGSSGRVFPKAMKASPLLRAWLARLGDLGVEVRTRMRWEGWEDGVPILNGNKVGARATVLAMGGASWSRLGSDGLWTPHLPGEVTPFTPSNMGFNVGWSPHMDRWFGAPLKQVRLRCPGASVLGECVISARGLEGSAIYSLSRPLLAALGSGQADPLRIDLLPDMDEATLTTRLSRPRGKASLANHLRKTLGLTGAKAALLREAGLPDRAPADLARRIKAVPIAVIGPRPVDEAISVAGGLAAGALDKNLMLINRPGVFAAGEMLDWDAPTGGYLITTCLATGRHAGQAAAAYAQHV